MARTEEVELTNMCMICDGKGNVLVQNKKNHPTWSGWNFPGGHVEEGEYVTPSVIREMKEETGLTITNPQLCGIKEWINEDGSRYVVFLFRAEEFSGELVSSSEGDVFWVEKNEVLKLPWIWSMDGIMKILADGKYTELFLDMSDDWKPVLK
jgi:8-oxo-dGTP diphosphatase